MSSKLLIAIIQEEDYETVVSALNKEHFYLTRLSSSGGFLRKKNYTIMMAVPEEEHDHVVQILKNTASKRRHVVRKSPLTLAGAHGLEAGTHIPSEMDIGGVTLFTMPLDSIEKF